MFYDFKKGVKLKFMKQNKIISYESYYHDGAIKEHNEKKHKNQINQHELE